MTTPQTELIITPELSMQGLKKVETQIAKTMKNAGEDAEKSLTKSVAKGITGGVRRGGRAVKDFFSRNRSAISGGAKMVGSSIAGIAIAGYVDAIEKFQNTSDLVGGLLGESQAQRSINAANATGFNNLADFTQVRNQFRAAGFSDDAAITDVLQDISERAAESKVEGGNPVLKAFADKTGKDQINSILASLSQLSGGDQIQRLAEIGISGEDANALLGLINSASDGGTKSAQETLKTLNDQGKTQAQLDADLLRQEAELAKEYRLAEAEANREFRKAILDNLGGADIKTIFEARKIEQEKQTTALQNFQSNADAALTAQQSIDTVMGEMNTAMQQVTGFVRDIHTAVDEFDIDLITGQLKRDFEQALDNAIPDFLK